MADSSSIWSLAVDIIYQKFRSVAQLHPNNQRRVQRDYKAYALGIYTFELPRSDAFSSAVHCLETRLSCVGRAWMLIAA